ncbi:MAG: pyruvate dehydrogenase (acetyl-transferring) E1 component subunit alpha, partial [Actinomycetales bacterium]|nr:pyruvate dehydrogenase (acetyl-transferring) E1 component subunit alpha [Actinomycetales bacterium]
DPARDTAVVAYFGDGATAQGDTNEALVFAAVNNAPVVFFCQNNQWAISEPTTHQARVPLAQRGPGFGIPSVRVDGNDVIASYAAMDEALERARTGGGPTFIEAFTYRMGAHTTSDDPTKYRSAAEEEYWRQRDPIDRLRTHLQATGELDEAQSAEIEAQAQELAERVRHETKALGAPEAATMFEHVYASENAQVAADQRWFTEFEDSFLPAGGAR